MEGQDDTQITQWLKKLQQESWQLELLVSAFTIFLLIQAMGAFYEFYEGLVYEFNLESLLFFFYLFLGLVGLSIKALTVFLVLHLMLRGFWIGAIGLRSVQASIDFNGLNYSPYFTERLKKKVVNLDNLVVMLDQICSVIFSFSFLVISVLISFGLYFVFLGLMVALLVSLMNFSTGWVSKALGVISVSVFLLILVTGVIYLIDFFTLGFFKKFRRISRLYYPIYRFYGIITISGITKSIYYYLISKFSKKRIRMLYLILGAFILVSWFVEFDQYQYFPEDENIVLLSTNVYEDQRQADGFVNSASIQSQIVSDPYIKLFLRYSPSDNDDLAGICPDFVPLKNDGINAAYSFRLIDGNLNIGDTDYSEEDHRAMLDCLRSLYEVTVNDSLYSELNFYFYRHPARKQKGLFTMIPVQHLEHGEHVLGIKKLKFEESDSTSFAMDFVSIPFWLALD